MMSNVSLDEMVALKLVLSNVSVKDLIQSAMKGFAESDEVRQQDNANLCSQAINTFLR